MRLRRRGGWWGGGGRRWSDGAGDCEGVEESINGQKHLSIIGTAVGVLIDSKLCPYIELSAGVAWLVRCSSSALKELHSVTDKASSIKRN